MSTRAKLNPRNRDEQAQRKNAIKMAWHLAHKAPTAKERADAAGCATRLRAIHDASYMTHEEKQARFQKILGSQFGQ